MDEHLFHNFHGGIEIEAEDINRSMAHSNSLFRFCRFYCDLNALDSFNARWRRSNRNRACLPASLRLQYMVSVKY